MDLAFERDPPKAAENARKHGVPFDEEGTVFGDPLASYFAAPGHSRGGERPVAVGRSAAARVLVVMFAGRPPAVRLVSARPATRRERDAHEGL